MARSPSQAALAWAPRALGWGYGLLSVRSLNVGRGPWLLHFDQRGRARDAVLRVGDGRVSSDQIVTGAAALRCAEEHGLPRH